jgi:hypothetical protein
MFISLYKGLRDCKSSCTNAEIVRCHTLKFMYQCRDSEMSYIKVHVLMPVSYGILNPMVN